MRDDGYFGEDVAAGYDEDVSHVFDPAVLGPTVAFLAELAGPGPVLEFAVGTGRVALPLAERGLVVRGIDMSGAMVARLRAKPGGEDLDVTIGDFATTTVGEDFALVYLVFNTIMNLTSQDAQVACFRNAAAHLRPGGRFVVEIMVPEVRCLPPGETVRPWHVSEDRLGFDEYDVATQGLVSHHVTRRDGAWERRSIPFRYAWPAELDLMARIAGLEPRGRWSSWTREPFTGESRNLVAVWEKPD